MSYGRARLFEEGARVRLTTGGVDSGILGTVMELIPARQGIRGAGLIVQWDDGVEEDLDAREVTRVEDE